ncbi:MAG: hypothetical protein OEZ47_06760 [Gammaproteobacteria bacterium]|nr:hypothetical protein [Gammaproteobacteria bacterium]
MIELNPIAGGVVSLTAHQKTGDAEGEKRLEKSLNTKEDNVTHTAKAVSKSERSEESPKERRAEREKSLPHHLGKNIDTVA